MNPKTMNTEPITGQIFNCIKSNRQHSAIKGEFYVYVDGELRRFTKRNVTLLANGDEMLELPGVFVPSPICPFCNQAFPNAGVTETHNGYDCAKAWDARVKNYCQDCNRDTKNGKCPNCDEP